jgi:hypothetical protein
MAMSEIILRAGADSYVANPFVTSLVEQINESHVAVSNMEERFKQITLDSANKAREAGLFLLELKAKVPHGTFVGMFTGANTERIQGQKQNVFCFSADTARNYMSVAKKYSNGPITELPDAVRTMRQLYAETAGRLGTTAKALPSITMMIEGWASRVQSAIQKRIEESPLADWTPELRQGVKRSLEPVVAIYNRL